MLAMVECKWIEIDGRRKLSIEHTDNHEIKTLELDTLEAAIIRQQIDKELPLPKLSFDDLKKSEETGELQGFVDGFRAATNCVVIGLIAAILLYGLSRA